MMLDFRQPVYFQTDVPFTILEQSHLTTVCWLLAQEPANQLSSQMARAIWLE